MATLFEWDVFLSHNKKDKIIVRKLAKQLKGAGLRVWFDEWIIRPGADIYSEVEHGLEASQTLVLCMSKAAFGSDWVKLERGTALFRDPQNTARRFLPLLLEECTIPDTIRRFLYVDYCEQNDAAIATLIEACRSAPAPVRPEGRSTPPDKEFLTGGKEITAVDLSEDGRYLAAGSRDGAIAIWDTETGTAVHSCQYDAGPITDCIVTPLGRVLTSGSNGVRVTSIDSGPRRSWTLASRTAVQAMTLLSDGTVVAILNRHSGELEQWDIDARTRLNSHTITVPAGARAISAFPNRRSIVAGGMFLGEYEVSGSAPERVQVTVSSSRINCVAAHPKHRRAVVGLADSTISIWELSPPRHVATFEGHSGPVTRLAVQRSGKLLASCSESEGWETRVWDLARGDCLHVLPSVGQAVAFSRDGRFFAAAIETNRVGLWSVSGGILGKTTPKVVATAPAYTRYTNAKVVLIGESGVGKTGLANRLATDKYSPTESTHAMSVARIEIGNIREHDVDREVWLWDLAGQPDYRLIHQLFLHETSVALFVTNPQLSDPFGQVIEWLRALECAMGSAGHRPARLLVAARVDRGGLRVGKDKIQRFLHDYEFRRLIDTSAKTGFQCSDHEAGGRPSVLKEAISQAIPWSQLPFISTDRLLRELKNTVMDRAHGPSADAIVRLSELYQQLRQTLPQLEFAEEDVRKAVRLLGNQNVILPLEFGDLILLRPALLSSYASAVIRAARNHTDDIGTVAEQDILEGHIDFEGVDRLAAADEQLLLRGLIHILLTRSLCFAEDTDSGRHLVFPSQYRRTRPLTEHPDVVATFSFSGNLDQIFTTLVVRLWAGKAFKNKEIWQNAAEFEIVSGAVIGFVQEHIGDGTARLNVFADRHVSAESKAFFMSFVETHLGRVALDVLREKRYVCPNRQCGKPVTDHNAVAFRLAKGLEYIHCGYCDKKIPLSDPSKQHVDVPKISARVRKADEEATVTQDNQAKEQQLIGHMMAIAAEANHIFRPVTMFDYGIDGEIEFKGDDGTASGAKIYVQLKSGDSFLRERRKDRQLIFDVKDARHMTYWTKQPCDVYLVVRTSDGQIMWMNVSRYLREKTGDAKHIIFNGEVLNAFTLMRLQRELLPHPAKRATKVSNAF